MGPRDVFERLAAAIVATGASAGREDGRLRGAGEDALLAWEAFKAQAAIAVDEPSVDAAGRRVRAAGAAADGDLLIFEIALGEDGGEPGVYMVGQPPGRRVVDVSFTRQLDLVGDDGEAIGRDLLVLGVTLPATPVSEALAGVSVWGCGGPPRDDVDERSHPEIGSWAGAAETWAAAVEAHPAFAATLVAGRPETFTLTRSDL